MGPKITLHPIHPTLQFEAKHALRFLDNLLKTRTIAVSSGSNLFGAVRVFASGRDIKDDFATLQGAIGNYDFKWAKDTLECSPSRNAIRRAIRLVPLEVDFGDAPCDFLGRLWEYCPQPEVRACVRTAVSRLAKTVAETKPAADGGVSARFKTLARCYKLNPRERDLLLVGLCVDHDLLEYDLDCRGFLVRLEEAAAYIGCDVNDILPLVRDDSKLVACDLLDNDLTPSLDALEYLEGHVDTPRIKANHVANGADDDLDDGLDDEQVLDVVKTYSTALDLLDGYDHQTIEKPKAKGRSVELSYDECRRFIDSMKFAADSPLFGNEKDGSFKSALGAIYQSFEGKDLYPSSQEKAANLLYLVTKNHGFSDGNKRIAAGLFLYFLKCNRLLLRKDGSKRIADHTLVALTVMLAESKPQEKELMVNLVMTFLK